MFGIDRNVLLRIVAFPIMAFATALWSLQACAADAGLMEIDGRWSDAAVSRDAAKVTSFYAPDALAYPPDAPLANGRDAINKVWSGYFANPSFRISWKARHAEIAESGDIGYTAGAYEAALTQADGQQVQLHGKYVAVWKKQDNGPWMVSHDIWNTDAP